jgi:hypothetical protein
MEMQWNEGTSDQAMNVCGTLDGSGESVKRFVFGAWEHRFDAQGEPLSVRFVFDRRDERVVTLLAMEGRAWRACNRAETSSLRRSLLSGDVGALTAPTAFGLNEGDADDLPVWAQEAELECG